MNKSKVFDFILHIFFPNRCMFCRKPIEYNLTICPECAKDVPFTERTICLACEKKNCVCKNRFFTELICPFYYEMGADTAVKDLKFNDYRINARKLAIYMANSLIEKNLLKRIDIIIPIPLFRSDFNKRGYNQSELLADNLSKYLKIPVEKDILFKCKKTKKQHDLNYKQRQTNLRDAFDVKNQNKLDKKIVLLLDDVFTTGATMNNCANILLDAGASEVFCITATKTRTQKLLKSQSESA